MVIENADDVEKLYQKFKKRMLKHFRNGKSTKEASIEVGLWMKKKTGFSDESIRLYCGEFAKHLLVDDSLDKTESRDEDINGKKETK